MTVLDSDIPNADGVVKSALTFPVVGLGASAGGIAALSRFFERFDEPCGMAFVIILHLSPNHPSNVAAILQRVTKLTVTQVTERTPVEADHVYVIPPGCDLNMDDGHLDTRTPKREGGPHVAVDLFLRTLAEVHGDRAFAIVLSGMGSDGALGVRRINECGGVAMAQLPTDAEFDSMPRAAIATGLVDVVAPVAELPARLRTLWSNVQRIQLPADADLAHPVVTIVERDAKAAAEKALRETLALLQKRTRHDFGHYKRATVLRRLERRLQVNAVPDLSSYRTFLENHPAETGALLQDMLISVTRFFRDPEAFALVERTVIPTLFAGRNGGDVVRVWVPACATGEEAYTLAILLREHVDTLTDPPQVQIFATDIDERAVGVARAGLYPDGIVNDMTPARLQRFFQREGDRYRIVKSIRESVLFAIHNVLRDPPFSRLDLISCRNLLIYLDAEAQKSMLDMFRFSMRPGSFLLLGSSESADVAGDAFRLVDKKQRLFQMNAGSAPMHRLPVGQLSDGREPAERPVPAERKRAANSDRHRWALEQYGTPSVLVDARAQILHMSPGAARFFVRSSGTPSHDLVANTRDELRAEMSTALSRAQQTGQPVSMRAAWTEGDGDGDGNKRRVVIGVRPFVDSESESRFALVTLQPLQEPSPAEPDGPESLDHKEALQQLEAEIAQLKGFLRDTIEQSDTSGEELKASNEELQAINEELRSATEELETSKEELQSINEELTTVNFELKTKVEETVQVNDDLQNLIASTDIAVVFVDAQMRIKRFTPRATTLFNLIAGDVGRSLLDITHNLQWESVTQDAEAAFRNLRSIERETRSNDGRHYLSRVIPYRTTENKIEGAVMTFVDITSRVVAERRVSETEERLRIATETVRFYAIITLDADGLITTWNAGARASFGYLDSEVIGQSIGMLFTPEDRAERVHEREMQQAHATGSTEDERWHLRKDGSRFYCSGVMTSYRTAGGVGFAKIARDMTGTKLLQTRRDEELNQQKQAGLAAEAANRTKDEFLAVMSHELKHPLNLIHVNAELLTRLPEVANLPSVKRAADTIRRTVASQARIIDDLLDLSRARTGKMMMTMHPTSLRDVVTRIVDAARTDADAKQVALEREIDAGDALVVSCDPVRVEQIAWNLMSNAIKFTEPGGKVTVRLSRVASEAILEVTDTGRGIAAAFLPNVFSMFRQERRETANGEGGMGIGLALVKELTEAQGGRVAVRSPGAGQGATFVIALPVDERDVPLPDDPSEDAGPLLGLRILAVDDSAEVLEPFAELMRLEGAHVVEAHSGAEALERLDREAFDVLISDVGMPRMDGYQLINEIRQRNGTDDIVAIAMTGYGRAGDVQRATEVGFDAHLSKPASVDDCKALIVELRKRGRLA